MVVLCGVVCVCVCVCVRLWLLLVWFQRATYCLSGGCLIWQEYVHCPAMVLWFAMCVLWCECGGDVVCLEVGVGLVQRNSMLLLLLLLFVVVVVEAYCFLYNCCCSPQPASVVPA